MERLRAHGWHWVDPLVAASEPGTFRRYVQNSKAEIGLVKSGYVRSRCGWFSDRSACYLASGRPVVMQNTGCGDVLPTGAGLVLFDDVDSAVDAVDRVARDYEMHCLAARRIAESHLEASVVLRRLLDAVMT